MFFSKHVDGLFLWQGQDWKFHQKSITPDTVVNLEKISPGRFIPQNTGMESF